MTDGQSEVCREAGPHVTPRKTIFRHSQAVAEIFRRHPESVGFCEAVEYLARAMDEACVGEWHARVMAEVLKLGKAMGMDRKPGSEIDILQVCLSRVEVAERNARAIALLRNHKWSVGYAGEFPRTLLGWEVCGFDNNSIVQGQPDPVTAILEAGKKVEKHG